MNKVGALAKMEGNMRTFGGPATLSINYKVRQLDNNKSPATDFVLNFGTVFSNWNLICTHTVENTGPFSSKLSSTLQGTALYSESATWDIELHKDIRDRKMLTLTPRKGIYKVFVMYYACIMKL